MQYQFMCITAGSLGSYCCSWWEGRSKGEWICTCPG